MPTRASMSMARSRATFLFVPGWCTRYASTICDPTVKYGCMALSGSWKIMAILPPRSFRTCSSVAVTSSWSSSQISPVTLALLRARCRPSIASEVTLLPEPDSPTMPSVLPFSSEKVEPLTAWTMPSSVSNRTLRSLTSRNGRGVTWPMDNGSPSAQPHARVDDAVQQVDDQVHEDDEERGKQGDTEDHRQVIGADAVQRQLAQTVQVVDGLGEDRPAEQRAEVEAEDGDQRGQAGAQAVLGDDGALTQ